VLPVACILPALAVFMLLLLLLLLLQRLKVQG
jgi:hypothetical protein